MPTCYLLTLCSGSSVDQHSNNPSLFHLVEHISVPPNVPPPPSGAIPLEIHAYWKVEPAELNVEFFVRFVLVASTGLETPSASFKHKSTSGRLRTRTLGLPYPPVPDEYRLCADWSFHSDGDWKRQALVWPVTFRVAERKPVVTH